ncbi:tRNA preQ1(34) S-adenosylmethionine ribosyltransferase-isomerase QueA [Pseudogracilibacillus sp. SE30717A]|uniref:tRNA preQ1(34) S-adenosylmethionine ribosyltransferase-isomerase QueA n=1 Tax=Pseudogracilibacillus sp. SE30717A TaxID=3098293 RepID=UPI00300E4AA9
MRMEDYDYDLPEKLIAQTPLKDRTASKMLVLDPQTKNLKHDVFSNVGDYLSPGDCLVLNNSRVIPVRLFGVKADTNAKIEILLLHEIDSNVWEALVKPAKKVKKGTKIIFGEGKLIATCLEENDEGARLLQLEYEGIFLETLEELGEMPLPPYIKEQLDDDSRYQTVYAKENGSAAAPTAGLHFTNELLNELEKKGIHIVNVTLHVGLGTFRPVTTDRIEDHHMHAEYYHLSKDSAEKLNEVKAIGGKVIAVGTTSTRVLETIAKKNEGQFESASGWTDIFIYPPYTFQAIDGLITNFHLPKSTLLLLISALAGRETILDAYSIAIKHEYRFFSFGDAMFILPKRMNNKWL